MPSHLHWAVMMLYCSVGCIRANRLPDEQRLLLKLFDHYDTSVRPVFNSSQNVVVNFGFTLIQIMDMDEKNQVLITNAWLVMVDHEDRGPRRPSYATTAKHNLLLESTSNKPLLLTPFGVTRDQISECGVKDQRVFFIQDKMHYWEMFEKEHNERSIMASECQEWNDERICWNETEFSNMSIIRIPARHLWLPDIVLYNNADDYTTGFMSVNAMVHTDGTVFWSPPVRLRSSCKVDITYFPFDTQICNLKFGSWTYDKAQVDLRKQSAEVDVSSYVTNGEWRLSKFQIIRQETVYPIGDAVYPDVTVVLVIRRRILYYVLNIIAPCFWLNILSVLNFALPPDAGEKMTLGITVLLSYSVFMLLVADSMPPTSEFVPLIGIYLTVSMAMSSVSVVLSVMVMKLHHCVPNQREVPAWVRRFILRGLSSFVRCKCRPSCRLSRRRVNTKPSCPTERRSDSTEICTKLMNEVNTMSTNRRHDIGLISDIRADFSSPCGRNSFAGDGVNETLDHDRRSYFSEEALKYLRLLVAKSEEEDNQTAIMDEWKQVALVIDKLLFWTFLFITFATVIVVLVVVPALSTDDDGSGL